MTVIALVPDLLDRSRITAAVPHVTFTSTADEHPDAEIVIVDLARHGDAIGAARSVAASARIVAFGPHVDTAAAERARRDGADRVLPRSRFFSDVEAAIGPV